MNEAERRIATFRGRATAPVRAKLDALLDLERLPDRRIVPFLLEVLADKREPTQVRSHVLKRLRNGPLRHPYRLAAAEAMRQVVADRSSPDLRLQTALALAEYVDLAGIPTTLGSLALDTAEPIDLRYSAFTSLQRAGPTPECVGLLRRLLTDDELGPSAGSVLALWRLA
jgi:hypothetical protein